MTLLAIAFFLLLGFGVLVLTFVGASRMAGWTLPYVGIGLLATPIVPLFLDASLWVVTESLAVIAFFMLYPNRHVHGIIAPVVVLVGGAVSLLLLRGIPFVLLDGISRWGLERFPFGRFIGSGLAALVVLVGVYAVYRGIGHLGPKMRLAVRVLGRTES